MVFGKLVVGTALLGGCLIGGYNWGTAAADCHPYRVEKKGEQYVLLDKKSNGTKPIFEGPIVGTLSERLDDVIQDSKSKPDVFWQEIRAAHNRGYAPR